MYSLNCIVTIGSIKAARNCLFQMDLYQDISFHILYPGSDHILKTGSGSDHNTSFSAFYTFFASALFL